MGYLEILIVVIIALIFMFILLPAFTHHLITCAYDAINTSKIKYLEMLQKAKQKNFKSEEK